MLENRVKLFFVSEEDVLRSCLKQFPDHITVIQHRELPKGYEILRVEYDYSRRGFMFMVYHYTFPSVKEGQMPDIWTDYDTVMKAYTVEPYSSEDRFL